MAARPSPGPGASLLAGLAVAALLPALLQCRAGAEPSRGRGAPSTTTAAPPLLPAALDLTRAVNGSGDKAGDHPADASAGDPASCAGRRSSWSRVEAPRRLNKQGWTVEALPLERLIAAGVLLDVAGEVASTSKASSGFLLTEAHLDAWEKKNGLPGKGSVLLVRFGWRNASGGPPQPGVSADAAAHLVKQGRVVGLGVDLPVLETSKDEPAARELMAANVYALLNLNLTRELPAKGFSLLVLPSKALGASAASVRVVATPRSPLLPSKSGAAAARASWPAASGAVGLCLLASALAASPPGAASLSTLI